MIKPNYQLEGFHYKNSDDGETKLLKQKMHVQTKSPGLDNSCRSVQEQADRISPTVLLL